MSKKWLRWSVLPVLLFVSLLGASLSNNVYADEDESGDEKVKYFTIEVEYTLMDRKCYSNTSHCTLEDVTTKTETVEISKQDGNFKINNTTNATVAGILFAINNNYLAVQYHELQGVDTSQSNFWEQYGFQRETQTEAIRLSGKTVGRARKAVYTQLNNKIIYTVGNYESAKGVGPSSNTIGMIKFAVSKTTSDRSIFSETTGTASNISDNLFSDACWDAGIISQSWNLCPTLENLTYAAGPLEGMVDEMLEVDSGNYDYDSGTYKVWDVMRGVANVLMIIVLLVIIFSQLTGVGIDNYGIKKMLPKLILMAVLINLSFLICVLVVDLSNILGHGLRDMFITIANVVYDGDAEGVLSQIVGDLVGLIMAAATGVGAASGTILTVTSLAGGEGAGIMIVIVLVLALIGILAALLLFFAMLGARLIIIVMCIAIAPVAFVLYVLPNTQNLFKKWWDIFKVALIIYPICGALGGVSILIKSMMFQNGTVEIWVAVVALILPFLVFFLLPMLLKNAISMLGQVGGALTSMGSKFMGNTRSAASAVQDSKRFKESMQYAQNSAAAEKARRIMQAINRKGGPGNDREAHRFARAQHTVSAYEQGRENMYGEIFDRNDRRANVEELVHALGGNDAEKASAAYSTLVAQGGIDEALTALSGADWEHMDTRVQDRMLQTMSASNIDAAKSYAKYRSTGGKAGFRAWADGSYAASAAGQAEAAAGVKDLSYASHLKDMGTHALDGYDKDQMGFVEKNAGSLMSQLGKDSFGGMLGSMVVNSRDAKAQTITEGIISSSIANGDLNIEDLNLTPEMMTSMRGETAEAIKEGYIQIQKRSAAATGLSFASDAVAEQYALMDIRNRTSAAIAAANSDSRVKNKMNQNVKDIFGIT